MKIILDKLKIRCIFESLTTRKATRKMKTFKTQLSETPRTFTNNEDLLEIGFSEHLNLFTLNFNSKFEFFKTWNGLNNRSQKLISKHNLTIKN